MGRFQWAIGVFILIFLFHEAPGLFGFMFGLWTFGCVLTFTKRKDDDTTRSN